MKNIFIKTSIALALTAASANAAVLYNISSFNNNGSQTGGGGGNQWIAGITTISSVSEVVGTTDEQLVTLQTLQADPTTAGLGTRFRNTEQGQNDVRQTVTSDPGDGTQYFQFGIDAAPGSSIDLTSLSFMAVRATGGTQTRGYKIDVSIDGGAYSNIGTANVANSRNEGLAAYDLTAIATGVDTVDFRIFSTGGGVEYTNFAINGDIVAIPEPTSISLLGLGSLALILRRKK